jgi:ribA/ribD-fused uncharacterized protein
MASGFPLVVNGIAIRTSEALYQACRFPYLPEVQRLIIDQRSPMSAKMKSRPYRGETRQDWEETGKSNGVRHPIMAWCLKVKLAQNWQKFSDLLLSTRELEIVEDSARDGHWGAVPAADGRLVGVNALGRLLMELRDQLVKDPSSLETIAPPDIDDLWLYGEPIAEIKSDQLPIPDTTAAPTLSLALGLGQYTESQIHLTEDNLTGPEQDEILNLSSMPYLPALTESADSGDMPSEAEISTADALWFSVKDLTRELGDFKSKKEFKDALGIADITANKWLNQLVNEGIVEKHGRGYRLKDEPPKSEVGEVLLPVFEKLRKTIKDVITELVKKSPSAVGQKDLSDILSVSPSQAGKWAEELVEKGELVKVKRNRYRHSTAFLIR